MEHSVHSIFSIVDRPICLIYVSFRERPSFGQRPWPKLPLVLARVKSIHSRADCQILQKQAHMISLPLYIKTINNTRIFTVSILNYNYQFKFSILNSALNPPMFNVQNVWIHYRPHLSDYFTLQISQKLIFFKIIILGQLVSV